MALLLAFIFAIGSVICHQKPERSFFLDGHQLPVCARCTGLYLSAAIGLAGWFVYRMAIRKRPMAVSSRATLTALVIAAAPTVLSVASGVSGIADGTNAIRAALALPLGAAAGVVVAAVATKDLR